MPTVETANGAVDLSEIGSAWSGDRLYEDYQDGKIFSVTWDLFEQNVDTMLDRDGKARALEQVLTLPLMAAPWSIVPADGDNGEAEFVRQALTRPANLGGMSTPIELVIAQMCSAVVYRRAFFEKVWKLDEDTGRVVFDKIAFRHARTCKLKRDPNDYSFQGFSQRFRRGDQYVDKTIKADKALVYIHGQHRDPLDGISALRTPYACFESKQKVRFLWFQFLENQTLPKALAHHNTQDPGEIQRFARKVATLKGGGVLGIGPDQKVEAYESNGQGAEIFQKAMEYLDHEMFASALAGFADLAGAAASGRGSFALSKDQSDFFLMSRAAVLNEMASTLTNFAIPDLVRYNLGRRAKPPSFSLGPITRADADKAFELWKEIATTATPHPAVPREFIDVLTEKVAEYLGVDVDKVRKAIDEQGQRASSPGGELRAGIDAAAALLEEAGVGPGAVPEGAA
jgi:hypothetical protein